MSTMLPRLSFVFIFGFWNIFQTTGYSLCPDYTTYSRKNEQGYYYYKHACVSARETDFNTAKAECESICGRLFLETQYQDQITLHEIMTELPQGTDVWLGLFKDTNANSWSWVDGTSLSSYVTNAIAFPNSSSDCQAVYKTCGFSCHWQSDKCDSLTTRRYICQSRSANPCSYIPTIPNSIYSYRGNCNQTNNCCEYGVRVDYQCNNNYVFGPGFLGYTYCFSYWYRIDGNDACEEVQTPAVDTACTFDGTYCGFSSSNNSALTWKSKSGNITLDCTEAFMTDNATLLSSKMSFLSTFCANITYRQAELAIGQLGVDLVSSNGRVVMMNSTDISNTMWNTTSFVFPIGTYQISITGTCADTGDTALAVDSIEWYGCIDPASLCGKYPCKNGGNCSDFGDYYQCACDLGWRGENCTEELFCHSAPCQNSGTCTDYGDFYNCTCAAGYLGSNCQYQNPCHLNTCNNHGVCEYFANCTNVTCQYLYNCTCDQDYYGDDCQIASLCLSSPCQHGGSCEYFPDAHDYNCSCTQYYLGEKCESANPCLPDPCNSRGNCSYSIQSNKSYTGNCTCEPGFQGSNCETRLYCYGDPCVNNGTCSESNPVGSGYSCACVPGYIGSNCQIVSPCSSSPCMNNATCQQSGSDYNCTCQQHYYGINCENESPCLSTPCQNGGACVFNSSAGPGYNCSCLDGYIGDSCEIVLPCTNSPCRNNGSCVNVANCSSNSSSCDSFTYNCNCTEDNYGDNCQYTKPCVTNPCKNNASCLDFLNGQNYTYNCTCDDDYYGNECEIAKPCISNPCKNNASCLDLPNGQNYTYNCTCDDDYYGNECEIAKPCINNPCKNNASCLDLPNGQNYTYNCTCKEDYYGSDCEIAKPCMSSPCQYGSACTNIQLGQNYTYECNCTDGYNGTNCEQALVCMGNVCENNSTCVGHLTYYNCSCEHGYIGTFCETYAPCTTFPCQNNGTCEQYGNKYNCTCPPDYVGKHCEYEAGYCHTDYNETETCSFTPNSSCDFLTHGNGFKWIQEHHLELNCSLASIGVKAVVVDQSPCRNNLTYCYQLEYKRTGATIARLEVYYHDFDTKEATLKINQTANGTVGNITVLEFDVPPGYFYISLGGTCEASIDDSVLQIINTKSKPGPCIPPTPCESMPCQNNGTCTDAGFGTPYNCTCSSEFLGDHCEIASACAQVPCLNGATCLDDPPGYYRCICDEGYEGSVCENVIKLEDILANLSSLAASGDPAAVNLVVASAGNINNANVSDDEKAAQLNAAANVLNSFSENANDATGIQFAAQSLGSISNTSTSALSEETQDILVEATGTLLNNFVSNNVTMSADEVQKFAAASANIATSVLTATLGQPPETINGTTIPQVSAAIRAEKVLAVIEQLTDLLSTLLPANSTEPVIVSTPLLDIRLQRASSGGALANQSQVTSLVTINIPELQLDSPVISKLMSFSKSPYMDAEGSSEVKDSSLVTYEVSTDEGAVQLGNTEFEAELKIAANLNFSAIDTTNMTSTRGIVYNMDIVQPGPSILVGLILPDLGVFKLRGKTNGDVSLSSFDFSLTLSSDQVTIDPGADPDIITRFESDMLLVVLPSKMFSKVGNLTLLITRGNALADEQVTTDAYNSTSASPSLRRLLSIPPVTNHTLHIGVIAITPKYYDKPAKTWRTTPNLKLSPSSNTKKAVFKSNFFGSFAAGLVIPPNTIDFDRVFSNFGTLLLENPYVLIMMIVIIIIYIFLVVLFRRKDDNDQVKWQYTHLLDNDPSDKHHYLISVFTSSKSTEFEKAKVFVVLHGTEGESSCRVLMDGYRKHFQKGTFSNFILSTPQSIGKLTHIQIWHCHSHKSWKLDRISVYDLKEKEWTHFLCNKWLSMDMDGEMSDHVLSPTPEEELNKFGWLFTNHVMTKLFDDHIWLSVAKRPTPSRVTRLQRLSLCLSVLFLFMITNAMWYRDEVDTSNGLTIGPITITFRQIWIGAMASVIVIPPTILIFELFRRSKPMTQNPILESYRYIPPETPKTELTPPLLAMKAFKRSKGLDELLPEEQERERLEEKKRPPFRFPWWCIIIGYILVFLAVGTSMFFTLLYSLDWGKEKSLNWLLSMFFSFTESVIVVQPLKVIIVAVILTLMQVQNDESGETDFVIDEQRIPPPNMLVPTPDFIPKFVPPSIDEKADTDWPLLRIQRELDQKLTNVLRNMFVHLLYLFLLIFICTANRDPNFFLQYDNLVKTLHLNDKTFNKVQNIQGIFNWINGTIVPNVFPDQLYNGDQMNYTEMQFLKHTDGLRLGPVRLRQVRVQRSVNESYCEMVDGPLAMVNPGLIINDSCNPEYTTELADKKNYGAAWVFVEEWPNATNPLLDHAFIYNVFDGPNDLPVEGKLNTYDASGYITTINSSIHADYVLDDLMTKQWIDRYTRAIFVEFTINNANINIFSMVRVIIETPALGGIFMSKQISTFRPYPYVEAFDIILLIIQIVWAGAVFYIMVSEIMKVKKYGCFYFESVWNWLVMTEVALALMSMACFIVRSVFLVETVEEVKNNLGTFVGFDRVTNWDTGYTYVIAVDLFLATLHLFRPLTFNYSLAVLQTVLRRSFQAVLSYMFIFLIIIIAFGSCLHLYLGYLFTAFSTFLYTSFNLFGVMLGVIKYKDVVIENNVFFKLVFGIYTMTMVFVIMNMFISIINDTLSVVCKEDEEKQGFDRELNDHMWKKIDSWVSSVIGMKGRNKVEPKEDLYSTMEPPSMSELIVQVEKPSDYVPWSTKYGGNQGFGGSCMHIKSHTWQEYWKTLRQKVEKNHQELITVAHLARMIYARFMKVLRQMNEGPKERWGRIVNEVTIKQIQMRRKMRVQYRHVLNELKQKTRLVKPYWPKRPDYLEEFNRQTTLPLIHLCTNNPPNEVVIYRWKYRDCIRDGFHDDNNIEIGRIILRLLRRLQISGVTISVKPFSVDGAVDEVIHKKYSWQNVTRPVPSTSCRSPKIKFAIAEEIGEHKEDSQQSQSDKVNEGETPASDGQCTTKFTMETEVGEQRKNTSRKKIISK